jgi:hypothetical protein
MRSVLLAVLLSGVVGCGDTNIIVPTQPSSTSTINTVTNPPTSTPVAIQFRVTGNASSVKVRYSNERDGLVQTVTTLPYFTTFTSTSDAVFLSLEVTPLVFSASTDNPFLAAQIFVNGNLFREATSTSYFLNTIAVDGTWRRN